MTEITPAFDAYYTRWTDKMAKSEGAAPPNALHYGYSEDPANYQGREISKRATNALVASALNLPKDIQHQIADLGCGVGGSAAYMAEHFPASNVRALNIFRPQLELLTKLGNTAGGRVIPVEGNFMANPFDDDFLDGAYAIESSCYASDKPAFYQETLRSLRSGGRLVVCDVFDKREPEDTQERDLYQKSVEGWVVPHWHPVPMRQTMLQSNFETLLLT